jgi:hypothetical protein
LDLIDRNIKQTREQSCSLVCLFFRVFKSRKP